MFELCHNFKCVKDLSRFDEGFTYKVITSEGYFLEVDII